jgi:hypothetical protein
MGSFYTVFMFSFKSQVLVCRLYETDARVSHCNEDARVSHCNEDARVSHFNELEDN